MSDAQRIMGSREDVCFRPFSPQVSEAFQISNLLPNRLFGTSTSSHYFLLNSASPTLLLVQGTNLIEYSYLLARGIEQPT